MVDRERMERYLVEHHGCTAESASAVVANLMSPPTVEDLDSIGSILDRLANRDEQSGGPSGGTDE